MMQSLLKLSQEENVLQQCDSAVGPRPGDGTSPWKVTTSGVVKRLYIDVWCGFMRWWRCVFGRDITWCWVVVSQVVSGGVASNQYIRKALTIITDTTGLRLLCPPAEFCTDNGVMIAWNGVERFREKRGILSPSVNVSYEPKAPLGVDLTAQVRVAAIKVPPVKMKITWQPAVASPEHPFTKDFVNTTGCSSFKVFSVLKLHLQSFSATKLNKPDLVMTQHCPLLVHLIRNNRIWNKNGPFIEHSVIL